MATEKLLIDANETINAFTNWLTSRYDGRLPRDIVAEIPTVDAVEVVHGMWIEDEIYDKIICDVCGHEWNILDNDTETFNYCPNCGAKMMDDEKE